MIKFAIRAALFAAMVRGSIAADIGKRDHFVSDFDAVDGIYDISQRIPQDESIPRVLAPAPDCSSRPVIGQWDLGTLISSCLGDDGNSVSSSCAYEVPFGCWNTSLVTDMSAVFSDKRQFNQPIDSWDTSKVTAMQSIFQNTYAFNQPLDSWDTSNVQNMQQAFKAATAFNQPLDSWDTSQVTKTISMFFKANSFDQPLASWDTSRVTNMATMFYITPFNQPLDSWDTSKVTDMGQMFAGSGYNQCISTWTANAITTQMFINSECPISYGTSFSQIFSQDGPWCSSDCAPPPTAAPITIGLYEILHIGKKGDTSTPLGQLSGGFPDFVGKIFFESSAASFSSLRATVYGMQGMSLPSSSECSDGHVIPLADDVVVDFVQESGLSTEDQYPGTPSLETNDGVAGQAQFEIKNINTQTGATDGTNFDVCIRTGHWIDGLGGFVSYVDTRFKGTTTYIGGFASFDELEISIGDKETQEVETTADGQIGVTAFLCDQSNEILSDTSRSFSLGQDFRICVQPQQDVPNANTFYVSSFDNVQCSNGDKSRSLVTAQQADAVTRLENSHDADGVLALTSLVLPFFLDGPNDVMKCSGDVVVGKTSSTRNLLLGNNVRTLQGTADAETDSVFSLGIQLDVNGSNKNDGIDASSAVGDCGFLALTMTAVTAIAHAFFV